MIYYGNKSILAAAVPGDIFAEEFACSGAEVLPLSAIAIEESEVMFIECDKILHTCSNNCGFHQKLIYNLMRGLAEKSIGFHKRMEIISKRTTRDKLLAYLSHEARSAGGGYFDIPFDRQELADYLEVDRSGLSQEISKLKREGIIDADKNHFRIL